MLELGGNSCIPLTILQKIQAAMICDWTEKVRIAEEERCGMIASFTEEQEGGVNEVVSSAKLGFWRDFGCYAYVAK